jgi:hypothetical protein
VGLLRRAKSAVAAGEPAAARALLNEHLRRFPTGQLSSERSELLRDLSVDDT